MSMRCMVITVLDLRHEPNQRTQHVARMLGATAHETVVLAKTQRRDRSPRGLLRAALSWSTHPARAQSLPGVRLLMVDPLLNYPHALAGSLVQRAALAGAADAIAQSGPAPQRAASDAPPPPSPNSAFSRWRHAARGLLARLLSFIGIARDLCVAPAFVLAALRHTRGRFDICLVEGPWSGLAGWALRGLGRVDRLVYDDIDHVAGGQWLAARRWLVGALEHAVMRRADLVISAGYRLGRLRRAATGRTVQVIPNGVDPAVFAPARRKRPHPPTLVYMGHLAPFCGVDLALRALPAIRAVLPATRLIIVGDGDPGYLRGLADLIAAGQSGAAVRMTGRLPYGELAGVLAQCDVGLATLRPDELGRHAFPLKLLEYMAAGLAVLCTRDTEAEEVIRRYPAGIAVPFDPQELAKGALELLQRPDVYARAVHAGQLAVQRYTWERALREQREAMLALFAPRDRRRLFLQRG